MHFIYFEVFSKMSFVPGDVLSTGFNGFGQFDTYYI
jgi:hypothetical protein